LIENLKERDTRKTRYMWKDNNKMDLIEIGWWETNYRKWNNIHYGKFIWTW
jgi:hypothetical protein